MVVLTQRVIARDRFPKDVDPYAGGLDAEGLDEVFEELNSELIVVGLVGLIDPLKPDTPDTVQCVKGYVFQYVRR